MYKELKVVLLTLVLLEVLVKCSKVINEKVQQALNPSDYCKKIGICAEGTHVMCTHFNPNKTKGPLCTGTKDVSINAEYAKLLLDLLNDIRSRSARGKTVGLGNLTLPKAYGMYRLEWDPELSTFAQLWANTCTIGRDMCRASKRFPDPGQVLGLTRFDEDWIPVDARSLFNYTGFSLEKVKYGIHSTVRSWYRSKDIVHPEDIADDDFIWPRHLDSNTFLEIVQGRATHVGCGISVFVEYDYSISSEHTMKLVHNVVRVICNLSTRMLSTPIKNRVNTIDPPKQVGYTVKCGCPIGYDEDEDCLCYESGRKLSYSCKGKECKPAVVILPIVTIEKAPPSKLNAQFRNESNRKMMTNEIDPDYQDNTRPRSHDLRGSIFLMPSVFELPPRKLKNTDSRVPNLIKNDVSPRRDFSNVRELVSRYLNTRRKTSSAEKHVKNLPLMVKKATLLPAKFLNTSKVIYTNNVNKENFEKLTRRRIGYDNFTLARKTNNNVAKVETKNRLMSLLNKLEVEAKNVQLACNKKNVLDYKIRKIYSTFVEKAFLPRKSINTNDEKDKISNFDDFLENGRLHKYEEQFNTLRENDLDKLVRNNNNYSSSNKQGLRNSNNTVKVILVDDNLKGIIFTDKKNHNLLGTGNTHAIKNYQNNKEVEINDFDNESSLLRREGDILTFEKGKYLERKLRDLHNHRNRNKIGADQHVRRIVPTYRQLHKNRFRLDF